MNVQQALKEIKQDKKVQYANSLVIFNNNEIMVGIPFKSQRIMKEFVFAWAMELRKRTEESFSFTVRYLLRGGELQQYKFGYRPHAASRGSDIANDGSQRTYKKPRFYHEEK